MSNKINIIKAFGKTEPFSEEKLRRSLKRSGASEHVITNVVEEVVSHLKNGMTTREIYKQAFDLLRQYSPPQAARYSLKQAINDLGPSGFPFEQYIARLFEQEGHQVQTGVIVEGHCVKHEIDVFAQKEGYLLLIECKFHHNQGTHSDVKVPLYIQSRFLDIVTGLKLRDNQNDKKQQAWIVTNTRFTDDAIAYGTCMGINLISWHYPQTKNLRDWINRSGLHPLTCLTTLTRHEKEYLLQQRVVLCKDILADPSVLQAAGIKNQARIGQIVFESQHVCFQTGTPKKSWAEK